MSLGGGIQRLQRVAGRHAASPSLDARIRLSLPHDGPPERLQAQDAAQGRSKDMTTDEVLPTSPGRGIVARVSAVTE